MTPVTRRRLLASAGAGAAGIGLGGATGFLIGQETAEAKSDGTGSVEFYGELEAGLFFICFQRDPEGQFVAIQRRLGSSDALNEYIKHVGSAVFAVPPGARRGGYVGETLLG